MPAHSSLYNSPLCQTLSKAEEISQKTHLMAFLESNDSAKKWQIDTNCLIVESPGTKPDCHFVIILLSTKKLKTCLKMIRSRHLQTTERRDTGL